MNRQNMEKAKARLEELAEALGHAIAEEKQYLVPITYDNFHNGNDEHSSQKPWATSLDRAIHKATHGSNGAWCSVDKPKKITVIRHTPEFTDEMIDQIIALPEPI